MATLINVCGASHSGTTMLDLMLGNAPSVFSCGEVYAWFRPFRPYHREIQCACGQNPCPCWEQIKHASAPEFHAAVVARLGMKFVIDSSKDLRWVVDNNRWARRRGMDVFNVLVWKDVLPFLHSYWKRGMSLSEAHSTIMRYYTRFLETGLPLVTVNYNRFVRDPQQGLQRMCELFGMPYVEGRERFWRKTHHHLFGAGAVRRQSRRSSGTIRESEEFSQEFRSEVEAWRESTDADSEWAPLARRLRAFDLFVLDGPMPADRAGVLRRIYRYVYWGCLHSLMKTLFARGADSK